jgi:predicted DNA-binding protein with PD1-like motif
MRSPLLISLLLISCNQTMIVTHALRLKPKDKLKESVQSYVNQHHIKAGWISACAGSLTKYNIRLANQTTGNLSEGHFEIVSLSGTVSENGSHIHICISDSTGKTIGGHLLDDNIIYTTAEIVILEDKSLIFEREKDGTTDWPELKILNKQK